MSERVLAIIRIGGQLDTSRAEVLIDAINEARLFTDEGDLPYKPRRLADLIAACTIEGHLLLCDEEAPFGELPSLKKICRELGLSYRQWHESVPDLGSLVEVWVPGMELPLLLTGDHCEPDTFLVDGMKVGNALELLERGDVAGAITAIRSILPQLPELPPFELIEEPACPPRLELSSAPQG